MNKKELRTKLKALREGLKNSEAPYSLRNNFLKHVPLKPNSIIATYMPTGSELDVNVLNKALYYSGHKFCLPSILEDSNMVFRDWGSETELFENKYGIKEPNHHADVVKPDIIIVPILGFNSAKYRIGYGGGYYDRALKNNPALKIGVAYAAQEVEEDFEEEFDVKLDLIITESKIYS